MADQFISSSTHAHIKTFCLRTLIGAGSTYVEEYSLECGDGNISHQIKWGGGSGNISKWVLSSPSPCRTSFL